MNNIIKAVFNLSGYLLSTIVLTFLICSSLIKNCYAEQQLPETLLKVKPCIVAVGTFMPSRSPRAVFLGTGFAVADGSIIVTNNHVISSKLNNERLEQFAVFYRENNEDKMILAKELASDEEHDLAILKLAQGSLLPALKFADVSTVREGKLYAFTGYPIGMALGLYPVTHSGIVSAISPNIIPMINSSQLNIKRLKQLNEPYNIFQLDATAYPGNSGSPLYEPDSGAVIAIINKVFVQESKETVLSKPSGITYAIPINHIEKLLKDKVLY